MIIVDLFMSFFRTGLFAIGGAYSFLPLIEREVVEKYHWLGREEFLGVAGIVKAFPGAISIKYATYTGYKVGGIPGVIAANLGNFLAPMLLVLLLSGVYLKYKELPSVKGAFGYIQLVAFSMIVAVAFQMVPIDQLKNVKSLAIILSSFILFSFTKVHPAFIIIAAGILGAMIK
jgi:chromate transporter